MLKKTTGVVWDLVFFQNFLYFRSDFSVSVSRNIGEQVVFNLAAEVSAEDMKPSFSAYV